MRIAIPMLLALVAAAGSANADPVATKEIPTNSIYSTNGQKGLKPMSASYDLEGADKKYAQPYGYQLEAIDREFQSGLSNVFLVRGKDITQAVNAARLAFGGGRSGDTAVLGEANATGAELWAVAYFGVAGSEPPAFLIDSASLQSGHVVEIAFHRSAPGESTRDIHQYIAWIPLGTAATGEYTLRLVDSGSKRVTLERKCGAN